MGSSRIDVTRRIGRRIIDDASQSTVYRRVGILSKTASTKRLLPRTVNSDERRQVKILVAIIVQRAEIVGANFYLG